MGTSIDSIIRDAYKRRQVEAFKFSPLFKSQGISNSIDFSPVDDQKAREYSSERFNFYIQMMESIVNPDPGIVKKLFSVISLFKYKNDKMLENIQKIRRGVNDENRADVVDAINAQLASSKMNTGFKVGPENNAVAGTEKKSVGFKAAAKRIEDYITALAGGDKEDSAAEKGEPATVTTATTAEKTAEPEAEAEADAPTAEVDAEADAPTAVAAEEQTATQTTDNSQPESTATAATTDNSQPETPSDGEAQAIYNDLVREIGSNLPDYKKQLLNYTIKKLLLSGTLKKSTTTKSVMYSPINLKGTEYEITFEFNENYNWLSMYMADKKIEMAIEQHSSDKRVKIKLINYYDALDPSVNDPSITVIEHILQNFEDVSIDDTSRDQCGDEINGGVPFSLLPFTDTNKLNLYDNIVKVHPIAKDIRDILIKQQMLYEKICDIQPDAQLVKKLQNLSNNTINTEYKRIYNEAVKNIETLIDKNIKNPNYQFTRRQLLGELSRILFGGSTMLKTRDLLDREEQPPATAETKGETKKTTETATAATTDAKNKTTQTELAVLEVVTAVSNATDAEKTKKKAAGAVAVANAIEEEVKRKIIHAQTVAKAAVESAKNAANAKMTSIELNTLPLEQVTNIETLSTQINLLKTPIEYLTLNLDEVFKNTALEIELELQTVISLLKTTIDDNTKSITNGQKLSDTLKVLIKPVLTRRNTTPFVKQQPVAATVTPLENKKIVLEQYNKATEYIKNNNIESIIAHIKLLDPTLQNYLNIATDSVSSEDALKVILDIEYNYKNSVPTDVDDELKKICIILLENELIESLKPLYDILITPDFSLSPIIIPLLNMGIKIINAKNTVLDTITTNYASLTEQMYATINEILDAQYKIITENKHNLEQATQKGGGAPPTIQQAINSYMDDPELSPNIDKVNLRDRGIFIVLTFIIRAIALFITEWAIYSGLINSFSKSFNMYFGVYLCIFVLVLILTNSKNDDITFFNQLFYYVNVESEDGKGLIRILLQVLCIFFILPIPYLVKDFRLKDKSPNRVLSYTDKSNIFSSVDKFTLFTWILTSIVALSV